jgi:uncharacterized protein with ParB-like and HNH nuclease domain
MTNKMPPKIELVKNFTFPLYTYYTNMKCSTFDLSKSERSVCGYKIPDWQRPIVWKKQDNIKFLESAWAGIPLGSISFNVFTKNASHEHVDGILIDGQQRLNALEKYWTNDFKVYGYYWFDLEEPEKRGFLRRSLLSAFETNSSDEEYLKNYYNLLNFSGIKHEENQRAI